MFLLKLLLVIIMKFLIKKLLVLYISLSNLLFNHNRLAQSITCLDFKD